MSHSAQSLAERVLIAVSPSDVSTIISRALASSSGNELYETLVNSGITAGVEKIESLILHGMTAQAYMLKNILAELEETQQTVANDPDSAVTKLSESRIRVADHIRVYVDNVLAANANRYSQMYGMSPEMFLAEFPPDEETEKHRKEYAACAFIAQTAFFGWVALVMTGEEIVEDSDTCDCGGCLNKRAHMGAKPVSEHMENAIKTFGTLEAAMREFAHSRIRNFKRDAAQVTDAFGNLDVATPESIRSAVSGILSQIGGASRESGGE